ncbi:Predicted transcriptional regulator YheO, contains PAS and DNA-binding HTH domains [Lachnospiraceae bacterium]|nr:Predicted transcriptional regulator YheO, contains PAS and DNA-binding HTH domains [Lachnospiraceae bacterium]
MNKAQLDEYKRLVKALAVHFGPDTEIALHDMTAKDPDHCIVAIENGHISGRKIGDGPSHIVIESMKEKSDKLQDRLAYLTRSEDGKTLKSSTVYLRNDKGKIIGILSINTDITMSLAVEERLRAFNSVNDPDKTPEPITTSVNELLDELIDQSLKLIGKPTSLMSKDEKIKAIRFLNDSGAFLIQKSGPKVCQVFGISKFTLYSYLDDKKND